MSLLLKKSELFEPIKKYWTQIGCKDINVFDEINRVVNENKLINTYNKSIDNAMYHSINYYDNINLLMLVNINKNKAYKYYISHLKDSHHIYGIKNIHIKFDILHKVLYQVQYQDIYDYDKLINTIIKDYPFYSKYEDDVIEINILILIKKKNYEIILNELKDSIMYYTNDANIKKVISSIFFNENSLTFLEQQNLTKILNEEYKDKLIEFHNFRSNIIKYKNFTQEKIMLCSSIILMTLGIRLNNDIDVYIDDIDEKEELINHFRKLDNIDFKVKNSDEWPSHWNTWLDEWAKKCGAKYYEEIIGFNEYCYYFCGIKFMNLNVDIERRKTRSRPASMTDLFMINKLLNLNISIPDIPESYIEYKKVEFIREEEKDSLIKKGAIFDEELEEYKITHKTNTNIYLSKIQNYLKNRYNIDLPFNELKNIFKVKTKKLKIKIKK